MDITSNNHHIIIIIKIKIAILSNQIVSHLFFNFLYQSSLIWMVVSKGLHVKHDVSEVPSPSDLSFHTFSCMQLEYKIFTIRILLF